MQAISFPALAISLVALIISVYGVLERRSAARRAERLRFAEIVDELNSLFVDHLRTEPDLPDSDLGDALNSRRELLCAQALPMVGRFGEAITSPEYRTLAHALSRAGYPSEADETWRHAIATARGSTTQTLFARRGYAFFLFDAGRLDDARGQMGHALSTVAGPDDAARVHRISTLVFWARAEEGADRAGSEAAGLRREAARLTSQVEAADARRRMRNLVEGRDQRSVHPNGSSPEVSDDDNPR